MCSIDGNMIPRTKMCGPLILDKQFSYLKVKLFLQIHEIMDSKKIPKNQNFSQPNHCHLVILAD
jgi:hypothetical protein